jgi:hypothetical protein
LQRRPSASDMQIGAKTFDEKFHIKPFEKFNDFMALFLSKLALSYCLYLYGMLRKGKMNKEHG